MTPDRRRQLGLIGIFASTFFAVMAFSYISPVEALRLHEVGTPNVQIAMITSAWALAILVGGPFSHRIISRLGPLRTLVAGLLGTATCSMLAGFFPHPWAWGVLRFTSGLCFGPVWALMEAWINTLARPEARARTTASYVIIYGISVSVAPLLLNVVGPQGVLPFLIAATLIVTSTIPFVALRGLPTPHDDDSSPSLAGVIRQFPVIIMLAGVAGFAEQVPMGLLPMFVVEEGHSVAFLTTLMAAVGLGKVVFTIPLGAVADKFGVVVTLAVGSLVSAGLALGIGFSIHADLPLYVCAFAMGATLDLFYALGLALIGIRFDRAQFAAANTVFIMLYSIGGFAGTTGTGAMMDWVGPFGYAGTIALVFAVMGTTLYLIRKSITR